MKHVNPADVPEDRAMQLMSTQRRERSGNGVRFRETMSGSLQVNGDSRAARLTLEAHIAGWAPFLRDAVHPVSLSGTVELRISTLGTLKLASSIRGDAFTRTKRAAAAARFLAYFTRSALAGLMRDPSAAPTRGGAKGTRNP